MGGGPGPRPHQLEHMPDRYPVKDFIAKMWRSLNPCTARHIKKTKTEQEERIIELKKPRARKETQ